MMEYTNSFYAEHAVFLPEGQEERHGHDWNLRVAWRQGNGEEIRRHIAGSLENIEGMYLNSLPDLEHYGASAESVARWLFLKWKPEVEKAGGTLKMVELEEEAGCWARYWNEKEIRGLHRNAR